MTNYVLTPQIHPSWMQALARGEKELRRLGISQLRVVRLLLDWFRDATTTAPPRGGAWYLAHQGNEELAAAAAMTAAMASEAAELEEPELQRALRAWAEMDTAIAAFAGAQAKREDRVSSLEIVRLDTMRTIAGTVAKAARATATALMELGNAEIAEAASSLEQAFAACAEQRLDVATMRLEDAVTRWRSVVNGERPAKGTIWWTPVAARLSTLADAMNEWLDAAGAGGDVADALSHDRATVREAARRAAAAAMDEASLRCGDLASDDWKTEAAAARTLAHAARQTAQITFAEGSENGALRPRELQIAATEAATAWLAAAAAWANLGEDLLADGCRASAVALGTIAIRDGITAASLGWTAREAWRAVIDAVA